MPGFGQFYNRHFFKGVLFLAIEHIVNSLSGINKAIYLDFNGFHERALQTINYQFALFYPGVLATMAWESFASAKDNHPGNKPAILFLLTGTLGTFAAIYANYLPFPLLSGGLVIYAPMILAAIIFRNS
jgi:hypothetical protein